MYLRIYAYGYVQLKDISKFVHCTVVAFSQNEMDETLIVVVNGEGFNCPTLDSGNGRIKDQSSSPSTVRYHRSRWYSRASDQFNQEPPSRSFGII